MVYYHRVVKQDQEQVWRIEPDEAVIIGIEGAQRGSGTFFSRGRHANIWDAMRAGTEWFEGDQNPFAELDLAPREFYPRIARPISYTRQQFMRSPSAENSSNAVALGVGQATTLMRRLDFICQTVHPESATLNVYGHEIRNLLILAATEVESHWRGVLIANGTTRTRLSTNEYVRLLGPMRLESYAIGFTSFPWLAPVQPFAGWNAADPSRTLPWYDAYNVVKHDREGAFERAQLGHAIHAVSACIVMLVAQFTESIGLGGASDLRRYFRIIEVPRWEAREIYSDYASVYADWTERAHTELIIA